MAAMDGTVTQTEDRLLQVLEQHRDAIMTMPHVVGVGIGRCGAETCIKILVSVRSDEVEAQLAILLDKHPYTIEETEPLQTLPSPREP